MVSALDLAKYILKRSNKELSNLELQKTLYFTELDYIKKFNEHLIEDEFEAWRYGPVSREVYCEYRNYGANSIDKPEQENLSSILDKDELDVIDNAIKECNKETYWNLVEKSHKKGGAWEKSFKEGSKEAIKKELIKKEALNES
ncbi:Panacea domain-containing protein [Campylobacter jejuni]